MSRRYPEPRRPEPDLLDVAVIAAWRWVRDHTSGWAIFVIVWSFALSALAAYKIGR